MRFRASGVPTTPVCGAGNGLVSLTAPATITDGDGDTATDSAIIDLGGNIRFADDGPTINVCGDETRRTS